MIATKCNLTDIAKHPDGPGRGVLALLVRDIEAKAPYSNVDYRRQSVVAEATEARLYRLVRERLAGTTVFSVGHRATLRHFHSRQLLVRANGNGPSSIVEVTAVPESARRDVVMHDEPAAMAG